LLSTNLSDSNKGQQVTKPNPLKEHPVRKAHDKKAKPILGSQPNPTDKKQTGYLVPEERKQIWKRRTNKQLMAAEEKVHPEAQEIANKGTQASPKICLTQSSRLQSSHAILMTQKT